jgi:hypothetical protein
MSKILTAALLGAITLGFAAAPITFDPSTATLTMTTALAKKGADDGPGDDRGGRGRGRDDSQRDDRGGRHGGGGKGRGGHDDGPNHTSISGSYQIAKHGADDGPGDDRGGQGRGRNDGPGDDRGGRG